MTDGGAIRPRRQWPLWLIAMFCVLWIAAVVTRAAVPHGPAADADLFIAVVPPLLGLLFVASLGRGLRPREVDELEARAARAETTVTTLHETLRGLEVTLSACVDRTQHLAEAAGSGTGGLTASAAGLVAAAQEVVQSGVAAADHAARLAANLPQMQHLNAELATMGGRLGGETVEQLKLVEALLGAVQVRGDEVAVQADAAIASLNKQLAEIDEQSRQTTSRIAKRAYALDAAVDGASGRAAALLESVGETIAARMTALDERLAVARTALQAVGDEGTTVIGGRLDQLLTAGGQLTELFTAFDGQSDGVFRAIAGQLDALPDRLATARQSGDTTFDRLAARTAALAAALDALDVPLAASGTTLAALDGQLGRLQAVANQFDATLATGLPAATGQLDALAGRSDGLTREVSALGGAIDRGIAAMSEIAAAVGTTRGEVAALGDADLRLVDDRLNATAAVMRDIGRQITAYGVLSGHTKATIEGDLGQLAAQFRDAERDGEARLTALGDRIGTIRGAIEELIEPIGRARTGMGDVEAQVDRVGETAADLSRRLGAVLDATGTAFTGMHDRAAALLAESEALQLATADGTAALAAVSDRFGHERGAFADAAATLGAAFDRAREVLDALDAATARVTADTADALGQTFVRARELAETNTAALQAMLAAVIREAEDALGRSGAEIAEAAFSAPIRRELTALEDAAGHARDLAEAAAQRVAGQVRTVGTLIDGVNDKVGEIETRLDVRARDTLSARSARLLAMLATASVDVAKLLSIDAGEQAWVEYLRGDRSVFARRTVKLIDRSMSDKIARHFAHDEPFRDEASHYLDVFEQLSRRLMSDPDGDTLLATAVSSDLGKLYVVLARATGRWSPVA